MKYAFFADSLMVWAKMSTSALTANGSLLFRKTTALLSTHCWRGTSKFPLLCWRFLLRSFLGYSGAFLGQIAKPSLLLSWHLVVGADVCKKAELPALHRAGAPGHSCVCRSATHLVCKASKAKDSKSVSLCVICSWMDSASKQCLG